MEAVREEEREAEEARSHTTKRSLDLHSRMKLKRFRHIFDYLASVPPPPFNLNTTPHPPLTFSLCSEAAASEGQLCSILVATLKWSIPSERAYQHVGPLQWYC